MMKFSLNSSCLRPCPHTARYLWIHIIRVLTQRERSLLYSVCFFLSFFYSCLNWWVGIITETVWIKFYHYLSLIERVHSLDSSFSHSFLFIFHAPTFSLFQLTLILKDDQNLHNTMWLSEEDCSYVQRLKKITLIVRRTVWPNEAFRISNVYHNYP